jgi:type I restriction enzyme M protein
MNRQIAAKAQGILFIKIENDGFDLGAQRRAIDRNDLPAALKAIKEFQKIIINRKVAEVKKVNKSNTAANVLIVPKETTTENGEYNLTGDRYRVVERHGKQKWPMVRLGDVCEINSESSDPKTLYGKADYTYIDISSVENGTGVVSLSNIISTEDSPSRARRIVKNNDILISTVRPNLKAFVILHNLPEKCIASTGFAVLRCKKLIIPAYLYVIIFSDFIIEQMVAKMGKGAYPSINSSDIKDISIYLPPLEIQQGIVAEIEGYQKVIDGARQVVDNWKPQIEVDPEWPVVKLGDVCENVQYGLSVPLALDGKGYKTFRMNELVDGNCVDNGKMKYANITNKEFKKYQLIERDVLFNRSNSFEHVGRTGIFTLSGNYCFASYLIRLSINKDLANPFFINIFMNSDDFQQGIKQFASRAIGQSNINAKNLIAYNIPLPPLETQQEIVANIEAERKVIDGCRELMVKYEEKIKKIVDGVWGE